MAAGRTLAEKIWEAHRIASLGDGVDLLFVDRHLLHDLAGVISLEEMEERGLAVARPDLTISAMDHAISTEIDRDDETSAMSRRYLAPMRRLCRDFGLSLFENDTEGQGIIHVVAPEQGLTLPGLSIVCGDSHTTTHGALGALAWGIGSSEVTHVLATQTIRVRRPAQHRIRLTGAPPMGIDAKDIILGVIAARGLASGVGAIVEWAGPVVEAMSIEQRMVLCNMTVEMGAKFGIIAPDETTLAYLEGRAFAPRGADWDRACAEWRALRSDADAGFDLDIALDCSGFSRRVTWGVTPEQSLAFGEPVPDPAAEPDAGRRQGMEKALAYMDLAPGAPLAGLKLDWVFIGSCAGGRIEDLRAAAAILRGRRVSEGLRVWIVPGSSAVRAAAEAEGLAEIFRAAGCEWRQSGCALCAASNGETVPPGARCLSTSNRNFVGRQGPGARTHLASPAVAAASALAGAIAAPEGWA